MYQAPHQNNLHPEIQNCVMSLYGRTIRLGPTAVWESPELERVIDTLPRQLLKPAAHMIKLSAQPLVLRERLS